MPINIQSLPFFPLVAVLFSTGIFAGLMIYIIKREKISRFLYFGSIFLILLSFDVLEISVAYNIGKLPSTPLYFFLAAIPTTSFCIWLTAIIVKQYFQGYEPRIVY